MQETMEAKLGYKSTLMQTHAYRQTLQVTHWQMLKIRHIRVSFTEGNLHKVCGVCVVSVLPSTSVCSFYFLSCFPWRRWNERSTELKYSLMECVGKSSAWLEAQNQAKKKWISSLCLMQVCVYHSSCCEYVLTHVFCAVCLCSSINVCSTMLPFLFISHYVLSTGLRSSSFIQRFCNPVSQQQTGTHSRGDGETMTSPCVRPSMGHVGRNGEGGIAEKKSLENQQEKWKWGAEVGRGWGRWRVMFQQSMSAVT